LGPALQRAVVRGTDDAVAIRDKKLALRPADGKKPGGRSRRRAG